MAPTRRAATTVAGFCYLTGLIFFVLSARGEADLTSLVVPKDLLPYVSIVVVALSYVLGLVVLSMIPVLFSGLASWLEKKGLSFIRVSSHEPGANEREVRIWVHGSAFIVEALNMRIGQLLMVRLLLPGVPLLTIGCAQWLFKFHSFEYGSIVLALGLALSVGLAGAYRHLVKEVIKLEEGACREIERKLEGARSKADHSIESQNHHMESDG